MIGDDEELQRARLAQYRAESLNGSLLRVIVDHKAEIPPDVMDEFYAAVGAHRGKLPMSKDEFLELRYAARVQ